MLLKRFLTVFILLWAGALSLNAQDKAAMRKYENQLIDLFEQVYTAPTDNERYLANETARATLQKALEEDRSIKYFILR